MNNIYGNGDNFRTTEALITMFPTIGGEQQMLKQ
jgi:hypothetical protein